ncbi:MAG: gluconate 2-dehydrogenase subunit 3 family protein [Saprospiraceae bacterium]|nr:gluconate 2-dehydrogenase subunit 3 family protein [Saprospiraceae bacterium]
MDRREALKATSLILGYTLTAGTTAAILHGCKAESSSDWTPEILSQQESTLLAEVCESILPATDTPGAKDALCHRYIDNYFSRLRSEDDQKEFKDGLKIFDEKSKAKYSKAFLALNSNEREEILKALSEDAQNHVKEDHGGKPHIFRTIKELTVAGYCTSEIGAKNLLKYDPVPGPYQGCIDYASVGGVWALY